MIDLLVIAVIGSLYRLEGAWIGALVFVVLQNYVRDLPLVHYVGITQQRFDTLIGVIFLLIVLLNPGGIAGDLGLDQGRQVTALLDRRDERLPRQTTRRLMSPTAVGKEARAPATHLKVDGAKDHTSQRTAVWANGKGGQHDVIECGSDWLIAVVMAVLAVAGVAMASTSGSKAASADQDRHPVRLPGRLRRPVRGRHRRCDRGVRPVRRGEGRRTRTTRRRASPAGAFAGHPLQIVGFGCSNDNAQTGDQRDQAARWSSSGGQS